MANFSPAGWRRIADQIREEIKSGVCAEGSMLASETHLAAAYATSRTTIRKAIDYLVEAGDLSRRPHSRPVVASSHSQFPQARDVYVWLCRPISDEIALQLLKGISKGLNGTRYRMVVREPSRFEGSVISADERRFILDLITNDEVVGAIIERDPYAHHDELMADLAKQKYLVFMDAPPPDGVRADHVGTANSAAARECVEYLIEQGHRQICCVVDTDYPEPARDRIRGYLRAMRQSGLEANARVIVACDLPAAPEIERNVAGPFTRALKKSQLHAAWPIRAVQEILAMDPLPTALFVGHDAMACWICALLEGKGLRIPEDISVVGFDWRARFDPSIPDQLTTAAQDFEGFGWHAANLLLDHASGEKPGGQRQLLLNAPLVIRSSTASDLILPPTLAANTPRAKEPHSSYEPAT